MREKESNSAPEGFDNQFDRWLRDETTWLARGLKRIIPFEGLEYRQSTQKRVFDFAIALPSCGLAILPTGIILIANALENPIGHPFYMQERVKTKGENVAITKFRTMEQNSDKNPDTLLVYSGNYSPEEDPRNTRFGRILRAFEFDELPQLFEVLFGKLSLVDIRSVAPEDIRVVQHNRPNTSSEWETALYAGRLGLFSLNSAENKVNRKHILKRQHYDLLYARKASLGLDLYILYKTVRRMVRKASQRLGFLGGKPII